MVLRCLFNSLIVLLIATNAWAKSSADAVRLGNDNYRQGRYEDAIHAYQEALSLGGQDHVARYNLGNAFYRQGSAKSKTNLDGAITDLEQALADYNAVVAKNPKDADATFNLEIATKELEKLKHQKKEQERKQSNTKDQKQDQHNNDQGKEQQNKAQENQQQDGSKEDGDKDKQQQQQDKTDQKSESAQQKQEDQKNNGSTKDQPALQKPEDSKQGDSKDRQPADLMSQEEAKNILEDYQRNEEPKGLLNFIERNTGDERPVAKDW